MPDLHLRTVLSEILTGLGILNAQVGDVCPDALQNVPDDVWQDVQLAVRAKEHERLVAVAWTNGNAFLQSAQGLRSRLPSTVEWKGPQKPPGYEYLPADIRVDHVYLVSCKYGSQVLLNTSPANLFDRALESRHGHKTVDWFSLTAPMAYLALYDAVVKQLGLRNAPQDPHGLTKEQRSLICRTLQGRWTGNLMAPAQEMSLAVSLASAERWKSQLRSKVQQEAMTWRLLRLADAPYFLLGTCGKTDPIRVRIGTPWDWRHRYRFYGLEITAGEAGQPLVWWCATAVDRADGQDVSVSGHIEIRWSHGKFSGAPEAKVYLDTPHHQVPGYFALT